MLKDPLTDTLQDVEKQRTALMQELERTQRNNRQILQASEQLESKLAVQSKGTLSVGRLGGPSDHSVAPSFAAIVQKDLGARTLIRRGRSLYSVRNRIDNLKSKEEQGYQERDESD